MSAVVRVKSGERQNNRKVSVLADGRDYNE